MNKIIGLCKKKWITLIKMTTIGFPKVKHTLIPKYKNIPINKPTPTNTFFTNLFVGNGNLPINQLPYLIETTNSSIKIGYNKTVQLEKSIITPIGSTFSFQFGDIEWEKNITGWGPCHVDIEWKNKTSTVKCSIVRGTPYITLELTDVNLNVRSVPGILSVSDAINGRYNIKLNNGREWVIYYYYNNNGIGPKPAYSSSNLGFGKVSGTIRIALISNNIDLLDKYAPYITTKCNISYNDAENKLSYTWSGKLVPNVPGSSNTLQSLILTLPHHRNYISNKDFHTSSIYETIKGNMIPIVGDKWDLQIPISGVGWYNKNGIPEDKKESIISELQKDRTANTSNQDTYGYGKQLSRMGRIVLIAQELGQQDIESEVRIRMKKSVEPWMNGTFSDKFVYDETHSGINTILSINNMGANYGFGKYNDHHFHLGYFLYAIAIIAKNDRGWFNTYSAKIMNFVNDIASNDKSETLFPYTRCKDWFTWHSWASGLDGFGDSKNQESTSEAVNCYYAVKLLGMAIGDKSLENWGELLMSMEVISCQKYWHIIDNTIYPAPFSNYRTIGVLWSTKVDYLTFFGDNQEYIHGIQMLPFTPASEFLLDKKWVELASPVYWKNGDKIDDAWKGFLIMTDAIIKPEESWNKINALTKYDNGNSKSNTLYFVASQFKSVIPPTTKDIKITISAPADIRDRIEIVFV